MLLAQPGTACTVIQDFILVEKPTWQGGHYWKKLLWRCKPLFSACRRRGGAEELPVLSVVYPREDWFHVAFKLDLSPRIGWKPLPYAGISCCMFLLAFRRNIISMICWNKAPKNKSPKLGNKHRIQTWFADRSDRFGGLCRWWTSARCSVESNSGSTNDTS